MAFQSHHYTPPSFFEHLNYDVRQIVYQFMEDHLPPVSHSLQYAGFALSCKQAYAEVRQPAVKGLRRFLDDFQNALQCYASTSTRTIPDIKLCSSFSQVRHITIRIPPCLVMSSFDNQLDKAVVALRPILSGHFHKVTLLFVDPENDYPPEFRKSMRVSSGFALFRLAQIIMDERKMQSSIKALAKYVTILSSDCDVQPTSNMHLHPRYPPKNSHFLQKGRNLPLPISTSDIQIAWDWRSADEIGTPSILRGYRHDYDKQAEPTFPQLYVAESKDKMVGMQGIASKQRWSVPESVKVYWLLQEQRYKTMRGYCSAQGVGEEVKDGLAGMSVQEFKEGNPPLVLAALF